MFQYLTILCEQRVIYFVGAFKRITSCLLSRSYYRLQKFLRIYGSMSAMLMTFPLAVSSPERLKLIQRLKFVR